MNDIQEYIPATGWQPELKADCWLLICDQQIITDTDAHWLMTQLPEDVELKHTVVCGVVDQKQLGVIKVSTIPEGCQSISAREILASHSVVAYNLISHSLQIINAREEHRFCAHCGGETAPKAGEWSQQCKSCNQLFYPLISPCVIVLIKRGDEVLLVRHHRHGKDSTMHTLVAGFIEPGESAEQAVVREVKEETGITVGNVQYQFSQSWPFSHSLMLGFQAEYESGEIVLEEAELCDGAWFPLKQLPNLPPEFTIARRLIDNLI